MSQASKIMKVAVSPELSGSEFETIARIVRESSGIQLSPGKSGMVKSRLQRRLRHLGLDSYGDYIALVQSSQGAAEIGELVSAISTNVTSFNREPHHFAHFRNTVIPELVRVLARHEEVRIWSAGCSNGSEPYTIACNILEAMPDVRRDRLRVLATDIDNYSLNVARQGIYSLDLASKLQPELVSRWFTKSGDDLQIDAQVQQLVVFKYLNLIEPWPISKKYDAIFCRNVMIYFSQETQSQLFEGFARHLKPGAYIYIGHSERVVGPTANQFKPVDSTTYQFVPGGNAK